MPSGIVVRTALEPNAIVSARDPAVVWPTGLGLTFCGVAIGLVLAAIASRLLATLLYGFRPDYIAIGAAVSLMLAAVAALACFVPARRASRIDPMIALRQE